MIPRSRTLRKNSLFILPAFLPESEVPTLLKEWGHQVQDRNNPYTGSNDTITEIFGSWF